MPEIERRYIPLTEIEIRANDDGTRTLIGYAAVFNTDSQPLWGGLIERIRPGAFRKTLKDDTRDVICARDHNPAMILGRKSAGTVLLKEDKTGLRYECPLPGTSYSNDLEISLKRGDVFGSSFAFTPEKEEWSGTPEEPRREVIQARLFDVGPVTNPAYLDSTAQVRTRSIEAGIAGLKPEEQEEDERQVPISIILAKRKLELKEKE